MKTFMGYIIILITIPIMALLFSNLYSEWLKYTPFGEYIEANVTIDDISLPSMSYITAGNGEVISQITNNEKRIYLADIDIPQVLKDAFVTTEDRTFFEHQGVDFASIGRAILVNSKQNDIKQGGSTITQQLARNLYLNQDKTYNRKLTELLYSFEIEKHYSKDQILEMYINAIYFGNGAYGIEAAAQTYFNKPTIQLSKGELLFLAAIPNNPSLYNPIKHFKETKIRQERIIDQLTQQNKLSLNEAESIKQQQFVLKQGNTIDRYPDYVTYVEKEVRQLVADQEGYNRNLNSTSETVRNETEKKLNDKVKHLLESGVTIHTALDQQLQKQVQHSMQDYIPYPDIESSVVVIQHHTHELVSLTGAKDYKKYSFHRAYQSFRQPGSAIKPLLVYGPYLDMKEASLYETVDGSSFCKDGYCPGNAGNGSYGRVSILKAFSRSYNTPALRLFDQNGIRNSFAYLDYFNFQKVEKKDYRLPAAIGGFTYGMSPLELTAAYTSFYDGDYQQPRAIRKITDQNGKILYQWHNKPVKVWKSSTVSKMRKLLNSVVTEGTARKANYSTAGYIGGKTGTTNDTKDLWFIGLNDTYTTGVWVGKDLPENIEYISSPHLYIWRSIMSQL
ncbi:transglycosylase domain-containing protein [Bacillus massiliigorillae]|uniref:transglycosylase domain-containing protein n=1 Tax=Bacillus massiliigorillae TaxID=1243664 RepID=UPI00039B374F|nr:transglycosylase domain-containing protein [Bacillus massiliigorillae]